MTSPNISHSQALLDLLLLLLVILLSKGLYFTRFIVKGGLGGALAEAKKFSLDKALADPKNNAIAVSLAFYATALGLCVMGSARCPNETPSTHGGNLTMYTFLGCILLVAAFLINDSLLLRGISNTDALLQDNMGVATFEGGSFLACGVLLRANLVGTGSDTTASEVSKTVAMICVYWLVCQVLALPSVPSALTLRLLPHLSVHLAHVLPAARAGRPSCVCLPLPPDHRL